MPAQQFVAAGAKDSALVYSAPTGCQRHPVIAWQMCNMGTGWFASPVFPFEVTHSMAVAVAFGGGAICQGVHFDSEQAFVKAMKGA